MPAEIEQELRDAFELVDSPSGADGVVVTPAVTVDAAYLDARDRSCASSRTTRSASTTSTSRPRASVTSSSRTRRACSRMRPRNTRSALMLALLRRICEGDRALRRRDEWEWGPDFMVGEGLEGKDVLVVGPGRIGRRVAAARRGTRCHGRPSRVADDDLHARLEAADVVTLHCPLTPQTRHLIDAEALVAMKPTAVLVNTARGQVVDESALVVALRVPARSQVPHSTSSSTSRRSARSC